MVVVTLLTSGRVHKCCCSLSTNYSAPAAAVSFCLFNTTLIACTLSTNMHTHERRVRVHTVIKVLNKSTACFSTLHGSLFLYVMSV